MSSTFYNKKTELETINQTLDKINSEEKKKIASSKNINDQKEDLSVIKKSLFSEVHMEMQKKYQEFMGHKTDDFLICNYSDAQTIEIYGKNLFFWASEKYKMENPQFLKSKYNNTKYYFISCALVNVQKKISCFPSKYLIKKIHEYCDDLLNKYIKLF